MADGSVWFRAAIGKRKNAEARWLLPMICRRGGIEKQDIGAIRIHDTTTEFEISGRAAEKFAANVRRPDKEDNIRIEALDDAPPSPSASPKAWDGPKHKRKDDSRGESHGDRPRAERPREDRAPKRFEKPHRDDAPGFDRAPHAKKKKPRPDWQDNASPSRPPGGSAEKPLFKKKPKKKHRGQ
jgi:ATP-dependent RNA helicase DeaD